MENKIYLVLTLICIEKKKKQDKMMTPIIQKILVHLIKMNEVRIKILIYKLERPEKLSLHKDIH